MRKQPKGKVTLKLDAAWKPIAVINSFKGFTMCYSGRAKPVKYYDEIYPSVIVLHHYVCRMPFVLNCTRKNVFWRDNNICQYCGKRFHYGELTMDHVLPKSMGGLKEWGNITTACHKCNLKKGNKTPSEANMPLLSQPHAPKAGVLDFYRNIEVPEDWKPFLY